MLFTKLQKWIIFDNALTFMQLSDAVSLFLV